MLEQVQVNSKKKADRILNCLKAAGRHGHYDKFYGYNWCVYVVFYKTKE